ncbi:hypothetical protein DFH11DRAFT_1601352 [Phellopilus nigrolimitatus]|nr:hypothetical protein DFH11DRAFT_1601352 [Phellopilus nigrolimitatus]
MKILTPQQEADHQRAVVSGGAKGFCAGLAAALPASYVLQRRWAYYRSLPPSIKAFGVIIVAVPSFVISAERAGLAYDKSQWDDIGKAEIDSVDARNAVRWRSMSAKDKFADFAMRHQYSLISGSWVASMLGAYAWVSRDRLATPLQKITQTRVWAQGLTLGIIIAAAALTHGRAHKKYIDHSWRDILDREAEAEEEVRKNHPTPSASS